MFQTQQTTYPIWPHNILIQVKISYFLVMEPSLYYVTEQHVTQVFGDTIVNNLLLLPHVQKYGTQNYVQYVVFDNEINN
jgi:hypothetical protein